MTLHNMMGIPPEGMTNKISTELELISSESFWDECEAAVKTSLNYLQRMA